MLEIVPMTLREANAFVEQHHRHHGPVVGHKFSIGISDGEKIVGVAIVGRPVSRHLDDGWTLEVNRLCTDGSRNACSALYAAAWRAARAMGYKRLVTYILESENGASLRATGWKCVGQAGGLRWTGRRRPEVDLYPAQMKIRFEQTAEWGGVMSGKKNMRRISVLVTAQTVYNLDKLAAMCGYKERGRIIDKLVREKMIMLGGQRNENMR